MANADDFKFFPDELKQLRQWCAAGAGDPGSSTYKAPINPRTNRWASVSDPATWGSFEEAVASGYPFVGFMFTKDDPYAVLDLDTYKAANDDVRKLHDVILHQTTSYTEFSQSGLGSHVICLGAIAEGARNEANSIEMYSSGRFMICTGNAPRPSPLANGQVLLDDLYSRMKRNSTSALDWRDLGRGEEGPLDDTELLARIANADNADKFDRLCAGDMSDHGGDHSAADAALIEILCFYTPDNEQVTRLFLMSALGQRDKARRKDYLPRTITFARQRLADEALPPVDASELIARAKASVAHTMPLPAPSLDTLTPKEFPAGLVGEISKYVWASATRQVHEIALVTGIALVAGIAGRSYNVSSPATGLNQYIMLLAPTGTGKEHIHGSINRIIHEVRKVVPGAMDFVGPARFASGPALVKQFAKRPCFVSIQGEFGETMRQMSDPRGNPADRTLRQVMLDVYSKSGHGDVLRASVYSDSDKDTSDVASPALTLLGESAPEPFFDHLDEAQIASGLLPRFMVVEYKGDRPVRNPNPMLSPPPELVNKVRDLCAAVIQMQQNGTCCTVGFSPAALVLLDGFDTDADDKMRGANEATRQLWNRAHLKALRLAALLAVGTNPYQPEISSEQAAWAIDMVRNDAQILLSRFTQGDVGSGESKQHADIVGIIKRYLADATRNPKNAEYVARGCVPLRALQQAVANRPAFKNDRRGSTKATTDLLASMVANAELQQVPKGEVTSWFKTTGVVYCLGDGWS